jgi:hypothetical protein
MKMITNGEYVRIWILLPSQLLFWLLFHFDQANSIGLRSDMYDSNLINVLHVLNNRLISRTFSLDFHCSVQCGFPQGGIGGKLLNLNF